MKLIYTDQSLESLHECMEFLLEDRGLPFKNVSQIISHLLDKSESLVSHPHLGQKEEYLEHLGKEHRRLVEGNFKILYRIENQQIYITDFFDTRQVPNKMKG